MSSQKYFSISIVVNSTNKTAFRGFFITDGQEIKGNILKFYYEYNFTVDIITKIGDVYFADYLYPDIYEPYHFTYNGTTITTIPYLDGIYGAKKWNLWGDSDNIADKLAYLSIYTNDWVDIPVNTFRFDIVELSQLPQKTYHLIYRLD